MINKHVLCDHCRGTGAASDNHILSCPACDGSGVQITHQQLFPGMVIQGQSTSVRLLSPVDLRFTELQTDVTNVEDEARSSLKFVPIAKDKR